MTCRLRRVDILSGLPRINEWAFTTGRNAAVTYRTVRKVFATVVGQAGLVDVRLHDLRRTVMTRAAMAGVGTHVLRDLLGHKTTAMADRYIRFVRQPGTGCTRTSRRGDSSVDERHGER